MALKFFINMGMFLTVFLGGTFEFFQFEEYIENFFSVNRTVYGRKFYVLTGFHGLHVMVGLIILVVA